jgi:RNA recognition motif-containing protein
LIYVLRKGKDVIQEANEEDQTPSKKGSKKKQKNKRSRDSEEKKEKVDEPEKERILSEFSAEGEFDDERTVFAGGVAYQATKDDIVRFFSDAGKVTRVRVLQYRGKSNGAAFVEFETPAEARRAVGMDGELFLQRPVRVNLASGKPGGTGKFFSVYVGNLSFTTSEKLLRAIFGHCGTIVNLRMPLFRDSGKLRGFAVIDLDTETSRGRALKLNGMKVEGREIRVENMEKDAPAQSKKKGIPAFRKTEEDKIKKKKMENKKPAFKKQKTKAKKE